MSYVAELTTHFDHSLNAAQVCGVLSIAQTSFCLFTHCEGQSALITTDA